MTANMKQIKPRLTCTGMIGKGQYGEGSEVHRIIFQTCGGTVKACAGMAASGTESLVSIDDGTIDTSSMMKACGGIISVQIQSNTTKLIKSSSQYRWIKAQPPKTIQEIKAKKINKLRTLA